MARGGRENSNPAKTKTHSGTVEKETHFINVVGKMLGNNIENGGAKIVVYLKWGFGELSKLAIRILKTNEQGEGTTSSTTTTRITGSWWHEGVGKTQIQQRRQRTQGR